MEKTSTQNKPLYVLLYVNSLQALRDEAPEEPGLAPLVILLLLVLLLLGVLSLSVL